MYVELRNIDKSFGSFQALNDVSLAVEQGSMAGLLGPSGSGKTTILRSIAGLESPDAGDIFIDGLCVNDIPAAKRDVGFVFQNYALFRYMTVYDNIAFGLQVQKWDKAAVRERVAELLALVGLEGLEKRFPHQLSGGQKQRVSIARVFLKNPPILILDEATSALDNESERIVQASLAQLAKGRTTLTIAHRLTTVRNAKRILVLTERGVEEEGSHEELMARPGGLYARLYSLYADSAPDGLLGQDGGGAPRPPAGEATQNGTIQGT